MSLRSHRFMLVLFLLECVAKSNALELEYGTILNQKADYVESDVVSRLFPDPEIEIGSPAFKSSPPTLTQYSAYLEFIENLNATSPFVRIPADYTTNVTGLMIHLVHLSSDHDEEPSKHLPKPKVLVLGHQHGNEPAGGEAALAIAAALVKEPQILKNMDVLIVPRVNPTGTALKTRTNIDGADINRDHLLLQTIEANAVARIFKDFSPDVFIDCHEMNVVGNWLRKFGGIQRFDATVQYGTVANIPSSLQTIAERIKDQVFEAFEANNLTYDWYFTTNKNTSDLSVSMGGVVPDTARNIAGLRNAISFLIETRGIGIGLAHFKRRVFTHMIAVKTILSYVGDQSEEILQTRKKADEEIIKSAGNGSLTVIGVHTSERRVITLLDPQTGEPKTMQVEWGSALNITKVLQRDRPFGYMIPKSESLVIDTLRRLGVEVRRTCGWLVVDKYNVSAVKETVKYDVTGSVGANGTVIYKLGVTLLQERVLLSTDYVFISMAQPLANLLAAAMEPESESSFAASDLFRHGPVLGKNLTYYRLKEMPRWTLPETEYLNPDRCSSSAKVQLSLLVFTCSFVLRKIITFH